MFDPFTGSRIKAALRGIRGKRAPGQDGWTFKDLKKLPGDGLQDLAAFLNTVEKQQEWPEALTGAFIVMLPKGEGSEPMRQRPIGLLKCVHRLWAKTTVQDLKDTLEAHMGGRMLRVGNQG